MKKPELLAPGGSFLAAYRAVEAGADGVYLGLKEFSARKAASNFTIEQLRRIRALAAVRRKRIYVTVNTVIREGELEKLAEALAWLEALEVDGVIIQDLGTYEIIQRSFPRIPIHASTQMGIHNSAGLREAETMGFRRVILSRELPLETIARLRREHPGIELEVFIHGALCYSFSGACLASWAVAGRSGNRGDCAQICRSLFQEEKAKREGGPGRSEDSRSGHFFSCRDLFLGRQALALAEIGIDALKIEGRMKSPEYVFNVTRLYREILNQGGALPEKEYEELVRRAELGFSREKTTGYLHSSSGSRLIDARYPGHRGSVLGKVIAIEGRGISIRLGADVSLRDGIAFFHSTGSDAAAVASPVIFSVQKMVRKGREVRFARAGETVTVEVPASEGTELPAAGTEIRHLSSRFLDLPEPKEGGFAPYRIPVDLEASIEKAEKGFVLAIRPSISSMGLYPKESADIFSRGVSLEKARKKKPFENVLAALLRESGDSLFALRSLSFVNCSGLPGDEIFARPSELKRVKNDFFAHLDSLFLSSIDRKKELAMKISSNGAAETESGALSLRSVELQVLAHRDLLVPRGSEPVPFAGPDPFSLSLDSLPIVNGFYFLPLPPVIRDAAAWGTGLKRLADAANGRRLAIGLNNLSHLAFVDALSARSNVWFFADFYLYAANSSMLSFLSRRVPRLLFAYEWIEGDEENHRALIRSIDGSVPVVRIDRGFDPPLFYSLGCFAKHVIAGGKCDGSEIGGDVAAPEIRGNTAAPGIRGNTAAPGIRGNTAAPCPKDFTRRMTQGRNRFRVVVRDCVTCLFADKEVP